MPADTERLIELTTRSLAKHPELRLTAEAEMRRRIDLGSASSVADASERLACVDANPQWRHWKLALYSVTLIVLLAGLVHGGWRLMG